MPEENIKNDYSWLGEFQGKHTNDPRTKICSHCGKEVSQCFVYDNGLAYYCSEECLFKHFEPQEWQNMMDTTDSIECLEPGLAYYMDYANPD